MKISCSNNISPNFNAGLTSSMKSEISRCDIKKVSHYLARNGVYTDFKDNKTAAWCSFVALSIIKSLNSHFHAGFCFPRGIIVDDFNKMVDTVDKTAIGFTNFFPSKIYPKSDKIIHDRVVFLNNFEGRNSENGNLFWDCIDEVADMAYAKNLAATNHFLEPFLHELFHVVHENNMLKSMSGTELLEKICRIKNPEAIKAFQKKYQNIFKSLCGYAALDPLETVACDLSKRCIDSVNKDSFMPEKDFIKNSPYGEMNFIKQIFKTPKAYKQDKALRQFWNGEF